jgi:hypothetical protein
LLIEEGLQIVGHLTIRNKGWVCRPGIGESVELIGVGGSDKFDVRVNLFCAL